MTVPLRIPTPGLMTPEEFAKRMREIATYDTEARHSEGDDLMMRVLKDLGYAEGVKVFDGMHKWYA